MNQAVFSLISNQEEVRDFSPMWVGQFLDKGKGGPDRLPTGVNNSGKVKIPANQIVFGQRKAR